MPIPRRRRKKRLIETYGDEEKKTHKAQKAGAKKSKGGKPTSRTHGKNGH